MEYRWNTYKIYESDEAWESGKKNLKSCIDDFSKIYKSLITSLDDFLKVTKLHISLYEEIEKVYCYPRRFIDLDIKDEKHQSMFNEALKIYEDILNISQEFESQVINNEEIIRAYLENDQASYFKRYYMLIFNKNKHVNTCNDTFSEYQKIRDEYQDLIANIQYSSILDGDKEVVVSDINYLNCLLNSNREFRKLAYEAIMNTYLSVSDKLADLYIRKLKNDIKAALNKGYKSLKEMRLVESELPITLIDNIIKFVNNHLATMHKYVGMKKNLVGEKDYYVYDSSMPKFGNGKKFTIEEALDVATDCLSVLGEEFISYIDELKNGSIDAVPKKGKRTNNFTSITYAGIPYMCLNFNGKKSDVRTLIHELGHAIHLEYSKKENDFTYFEFSLFLTEIVAKVNEAIFNNYLTSKDEEDIIPILSVQLNSIFNQIMFTEFEDRVVNIIERGDAIDKEIISDIYEELLVKYNGPSLSLTDFDRYGWLRINHFILQESYYLYQYSLGTMLASAIAYNLENDPTYKEKYLKMLGIGNRLNVIDSLKSINIDLFDENIFVNSLDNLNKMLTKINKAK